VYLLYSLLLTFGFVLLLPKFVIDALRSGKYVTGLRQRLGNLPRIDSKGRPVIWLHCVSVGEVQAAKSLVRSLSQTFPNFALVISTTTVTGQQIARKIFRDNAVAIFYFPIDWAWTVRRVLRAVNPMAILIMETELWPRLFLEARRRAIPFAVLNGRISAASFKRYKLIRPFIARVLSNLTLAVMQSGKDAARIRELGMRDARIAVSGNLKFDSALVSANPNATSEIRNRFDFADGRPLIVAASTHDPEETVVLDAFRRVRQSHPAARLLLAPRHPERFAEVAALLHTSEFSVARRSARAASDDAHADIVLLDSIGELNAVYGLADVAFVGGSIAPSGGHNVIEPTAHGVCTITGPHTQNFSAITNAMLAEDALIQLSNTSEPAAGLARVLDELLSDNNRRREIGERAKAVCERNRGATERTIDLISQILAKSGQAAHQVPFSAIHATAAK
jgi:3-deoxy-D-manno-octulosonic-acid transferase